MFKVRIYISPTGLEVASSLLRSVRETVLAGHAGVAGGDRDGTRKHRSTGRAPQYHGGHVVCRTSNSAPRCHKVNRVHRERLLGINCSHDFRLRPVQAGHKLRHDLHIGHNEASVVVQSERCIYRPVPAHVFLPIFWRPAEKAS